MEDATNGGLDKALEFASTRSDDSLQKCIDRLKSYEAGEDTVILMNDYAPYSFYFVRNSPDGEFRGNGGVIFHGKHDNGGDGSAPTFSVSLTPTNGWSIHT